MSIPTPPPARASPSGSSEDHVAAMVFDDDGGGISSGHGHNAAARMRPLPAQVQPRDWSPIIPVARNGAKRKQLVGSHVALEDVASDQSEPLFDVGRGQDLDLLDRAFEIRRVLAEGSNDLSPVSL